MQYNIAKDKDQDQELNASGGSKSWGARKMDSKRVQAAFVRLGLDNYAARLGECASYLRFMGCDNGHRKLEDANFCRVRLCPMCDWRRSRKYFSQIMRIVHSAYEQRPAMRYVFLTLTCRNVAGEELSVTLDKLFEGFNRLFKYKQVDTATVGWIRSLEVTYNRDENTYHPHFHVLIAVAPDYFGRSYIKHAQWLEMWRKAMKLDYDPNVRIEAVYKNKMREGETSGVTLEIAKYTVKPDDILQANEDLMAEIVGTLHVALHHRRLIGFGKLFRELKSKLNLPDIEAEDVDLTDEGPLSLDCKCPICQAIMKPMMYRWHIGFQSYILSSE